MFYFNFVHQQKMNSRLIVLFLGIIMSSYSSGVREEVVKAMIDGKAAILENEPLTGDWTNSSLIWASLGISLAKIEERRNEYFKSYKRVYDIGDSEDVNTVSAQFVSSFTQDVEKIKNDLKVTYDNALSQDKAYVAKKLQSFDEDLRNIEAEIPNIKPYAESTIARMHVKAEERYAKGGRTFEELSAPLDEALEKGIASLKVYNTVIGNAKEKQEELEQAVIQGTVY